jgi:hypothetical protein
MFEWWIWLLWVCWKKEYFLEMADAIDGIVYSLLEGASYRVLNDVVKVLLRESSLTCKRSLGMALYT